MRYTESHEWILVEGNVGVIGITKFAVSELGEIVNVSLPKIETLVKAGDEVVVLESTKAAADVYTPVSGKILSVNEKLLEDVSVINISPEDQGWLYKIKIEDPTELETLFSEDQYQKNIVGETSS